MSAKASEASSSNQLAAQLLSAMQFAVFERQRSGEFTLVARCPDWLGHLVPKEKLSAGSIDLLEYFAFLEAFLPIAEDFWKTDSSERLQSEFWTESDENGKEYHLQAYAVNLEDEKILVLELADAAYNERRQVQLYAHEMVFQNETIARLNKEVERATQAKSDFLASMSHEIRTPLNAILGVADLLSETELTSEQSNYVGVFQRAGNNLLELINDILDLSKVESGNLSLESIDFDLAEVVERATELSRIRALEKDLTVSYSITPDLPNWFVGDPTRLRQILLNLLGNGMKFTENGGLHIDVEPDPEESAAGALRFAVRDTGVGIPADKLTSIFESFTQAESSTTRKYGGTGLGLAISKQLVELMGGRIWVESEAGKGSTFFFTMRLGASFNTARAMPSQVAPHAVANVSDLPFAHILLADDSEDNRFLIQAYLKNSNCSLDFAENGLLAVSKMKSNHYDLVIMDAHMPVMDGYAATAEFRAWEAAHGGGRLPIVALTADAFTDSIERSVAVGFNAHLIKPIRRTVLIAAIRRYARTCEQAHVPPRVSVRVDTSLAEFAPRYLENIRKDLVQLREAAGRLDYEEACRIGHNMKGTGASFGFEAITDIGSAIEQAAKDQSRERTQAHVGELARFLERVEIEQG
jgi:signal transduction histidine kinase/DNA-binding response OmpR family regulator